MISDVPGLAQFVDPNLINPWGIALGSSGPLWFADNNSGMLAGGGETSGIWAPAITVPGMAAGVASPTGAVFNPGAGFLVGEAGRSGASVFLVATEDGTILGWNPDVDAGHAIVAVDKSNTAGPGPVYTGLTIVSGPGGSLLFAANFRAGTIDVFDQDFHQIQRAGEFVDPNLPAGYVPFNVQAIGGEVYVTYVHQNGGRYDSGSGMGNGYVDVFDTHGALLQRLISQGPLNSPWGVALAPANFGRFSNDLLVGNFGDGRINAFDPHTGAFLGTLTDAAGQPISIPGLWALSFGNEAGAGGPAVLYFTAGIGHEQHGLFGSLQLSSAGVPGMSGAEKAIFNAIVNSPQSGDDYPLPPAQGPSLRQNAPSVQPAVLVSLSNSSPALVPTLLTQAAVSIGTSVPGLNGGPSATGSVQFLPGGGSLLIVPVESHAPESTFDPVTALGVRPGFGEPIRTPAQAELVALADLDAAFENEFAVGASVWAGPLASVPGTVAIGNDQNRLQSMVTNTEESQAVNTASALNYLLMFMLVGGACHFARVKDRLPARMALSVVTSLLSRITKSGHRTDPTINDRTQELEWSTPAIAECGF